MTKKQFINELEEKLKGLPVQDKKEAIKYYEEYFDEAGIENEQNVIKELRSPSHIASKILSDYAVKKIGEKKHSAGNGLRALWFVILGIFAAPVAIPVAIILTIFILLLCIGLIAAIFALVVGGSALVITAFGLIFVDTASALMLMGSVLIAIGLTKFLYIFIMAVIKKILQFIKNF